ncbi:stress responsive alpha-beta barrel domain-containing protein [Vandammella animalimorsus]|uniref:Stress responsive alpha-beta barrel domain-containing protein n=1 Tax=Vandammella animalimorsus TaxID=2029117 RepID=A0A2A2T4L3_9BURK|nr:Dabb family protein [Vandammella animalimorsus]PAT31904.1 stress responsive alpha-beta barrel domain-containing protein [Vandammella animalimorsus]PAX16449.1 stress responsive alpha-beta barrel domain-containing protein [Vandammella animalimorsus]PAX18864.1 stress responsive alpha-beta barrel domain-containing protein [Vandammella animalimorsus]
MQLHIVLMAFHATPSDELQQHIDTAFRRMPALCEGLLRYELVKNHSSTSAQYSHALLSVFASPGHLSAYRVSPEHDALMQLLKPHVREIVVLDTPWPASLSTLPA